MDDLQKLRDKDRESIWTFMEDSIPYMKGRVLDFGSGDQPYRIIVENAGCEYCPYDRVDHPGSRATENVGDFWSGMRWDTIICNQVLQYVPDVMLTLLRFKYALEFGGCLIMTYATNWPEIEYEDTTRITKGGMERMLDAAGFRTEKNVARHGHQYDGFNLVFGYGVIACA